MILSTLGVNSGKYYCEAEADALGGAYMGIGILSDLMYMWIDPRIDFESREN